MLVAFDQQTAKDQRLFRRRGETQLGFQMLNRLLETGRVTWRRKCSAIIRSRMLCHQRQIQSTDPRGPVTALHAIYAHKPVR